MTPMLCWTTPHERAERSDGCSEGNGSAGSMITFAELDEQNLHLQSETTLSRSLVAAYPIHHAPQLSPLQQALPK